MNPVIAYLLKTSMSLTFFYLFYWIFLRKETFFRFNRYYFLGSMALSLLIPFVNIGKIFTVAESVPVRTISEGYVTLQNSVSTFIPVQPDLIEKAPSTDYLLLAYILVAAFLLFRLIFHTAALFLRARKSSAILVLGTKVIPDKKVKSPFSFFSMIFINPEQLHESNINEIMLHEKEHIQQRHTIDLLIVELLTIFQWPNPFVWLLNKSIRETHEYLADHAVLKQGVSAPEYQKTLISMMMGEGNPALITPLNFSLNKKRIIMMNKMKSPSVRKWRSILLLPLIVLLTLAFSSPSESNESTVDDQTIQSFKNSNDINPDSEFTISGTVIDDNTGKPKRGVSVVVYGTTTGTLTDIDGKFSLNTSENPAKIFLSFVGYETVVTNISSKEKPVIRLKRTILTIGFDNIPKPAQPPVVVNNNKPVFFVVESMPEYTGGLSALHDYITSNTNYPKKAKKQNITGTVYVNFTIDKEGNVTDVYIDKNKTVNSLLDKEAVRVVTDMPKWKPAEQRGMRVPVQMSVPVTFEL